MKDIHFILLLIAIAGCSAITAVHVMSHVMSYIREAKNEIIKAIKEKDNKL